MSGAWVIKVMESEIVGTRRGNIYPTTFDTNGELRRDHEHEGRAAETWNAEKNAFFFFFFFSVVALIQSNSSGPREKQVTSILVSTKGLSL